MWPFGNIQKFLYRVRYNGVVVLTKTENIAPKVSWYRKKSHSAYLIPPDIDPVKDGNFHVIEYNQNDAVPLADIIDVLPDQVKEIEPLIANAICVGIANKASDETGIPKEDEELYRKVIAWMQQYEGTTLIYQLWRWGYFKYERWYKQLNNLDRERIDSVVFPRDLQRLGVNPTYIYEREKSTIVPDLFKRPEPKWAWLEPYIPWICVTALLIVLLYYAFSVFHL
jgi:hypothetical protein